MAVAASTPSLVRSAHLGGIFIATLALFLLTYAVSAGSLSAQSIVQKGDRKPVTAAERAVKRLALQGSVVHPAAMQDALQDRKRLLSSVVTINFVSATGAVSSHVLRVQDVPTVLSLNTDEAKTEIDDSAVSAYLSSLVSRLFVAPSHCTISGIAPEVKGNKGMYGYPKIMTNGCRVRDGLSADTTKALPAILSALRKGTGSVGVPLIREHGVFVNATDQDVSGLERIAAGRTNYKGSTWAREQNVKKAIDERLNGIVIPAGETFSFNKTLGGKTLQGSGWHMALGIFEGSELRPTPGGGICQTSTTMFRSALFAGLPVVEQANHSLFVTYYEQYGVGMDATVFPGSRDLRFVNDTGAPIVVQATVYPETKDVVIELYGRPDGRRVTMEGPYFSGDNPGYVQVDGRPLKKNEIAWVRRIEYKDGVTNHEVFVSRYKDGIGPKLRSRWPQAVTMEN